jgi:hypothetical protein
LPVIAQGTGAAAEMDGVVVCHSGHTYAQRPVVFWWAAERFEVVAVEAEWRTPACKHFRVKVKNEAVFELIYDEGYDTWQIKQM